MRGPRPKPSALEKLQGNPGKRKPNKREPKPKIKAPACPNHLPLEAKRHWRRTVKILVELGIATELDRDVLEQYCACYARWREAEEKIREEGPFLTSEKGVPYQSPWLNISLSMMKTMLKLMAELGMTPSSRTRIKSSLPEPEDEFEKKFING